jgi:alpha-tubulin suppressor-like RCC1 family protein
MKFRNLFLIVMLAFIGLSKVANAQQIAAGGWHSLAVCNDSTVKAFGENATGELGDGTTTDQNIPVQVIGLTGIKSVSAGGDQLEAHSMALKSNGTVYAWGSNIYGQLGNATTVSTTSPVQVLILSGATKISAGGWHSVALKNDGTVWAWGWNLDGQLGDGTFVDKTIATQVPGLSGVTAIAAGTYHVLALKNDGTVWAWGDNISGQIGDGSTTDRNTPVQVSGLSGVVKIAAGRFFSLAVKSDGTVWTWGENLYGQLGNGNTTDSPVPVQVSGLTGVTSATAATGAFHCMAVKNDNTVWAWGRNTYGNLGDNTTNPSSIPVQMIGVSDVAGLAAGTNFSLISKNDGTLWGCGRNASGQLGDGTFLQRNTVVQATSLCPVMQPTGIMDPDEVGYSEIKTFPNPSATGVFSIIIRESAFREIQITSGEIEVYNMMGQKVFHQAVNQQIIDTPIIVDLSEQPDGLYFMTLKWGALTFNQKLIKN